MNDNQQQIINSLSHEITSALQQAAHWGNESGGDPDKIDAYYHGYLKRVSKLREIRETLENEFTTIMYDPR